MKIVMLSMFMDEQNLDDLKARVWHLLEKQAFTEHQVRFIWIIGEVEGDHTAGNLASFTAQFQKENPQWPIGLQMVTAASSKPHDTKVLAVRLIRLSDHVRAGLECLSSSDDYMVFHESDLISQDDIIDALVTLSEERDGGVTAGWPIVEQKNGNESFYDTWAYRKNGMGFSAGPPYCNEFTGEVMEVDSVGSVWCSPVAPYLESKKAWPYTQACVEMCEGLRDGGLRVFVDPSIIIKQPLVRLRETW